MKKLGCLLIVVYVLFTSGGSSVYAGEGYNSNAVTGFYGNYEVLNPEENPQEPEIETEKDTEKGSKQEDGSMGMTDVPTGPIYSNRPYTVLPKTGDRSFAYVQLIGFLLLLCAVIGSFLLSRRWVSHE
ncbi:hypothetical protein IGI37_003811 [Enterococcus sp. AZ194]|uniref:LPXTG cell wall anchor domain-containing protein n=1 Tax=Enterococcus sp. AZ194 TaxID=2774629 RepID=UPI003F24FF90